jgi:sulfur carrier protein ThiS
MIVNVRLYGTLSRLVDDYRPNQGVDVEIPIDGKVEDLLGIMGIPKSDNHVVIMEGRILSKDEILRENATLNILQAFHGG